LNSNSFARVDYSEQARVIRLERGEAFFKVEHDTARPFWVVADRSWVRAVGTAFNVYVRPSSVRVTVSEGTVKVAASSGGTTPSDAQLAAEAVSVLTAGEQVDVSRGASEIRSLQPVELTRSTAWRTGTLYFENERLGEVVDELSRYTTLQIVVEGAALRDLPVGGTFQSDPVGAEALLTTLQDGFGLQVRRDGRTAYIEASAEPAANR
jgi:transmembrane sensor